MTVNKLSDMLQYVAIADSDRDMQPKTVDIDSLDTEMIPYMDKMCFTIKNTSITASRKITFVFKEGTGLKKADLLILDSNLVADRNLLDHNVHFIGPQMTVNLVPNVTGVSVYNFALTQTVYDEDDESKNCADYPTFGSCPPRPPPCWPGPRP
jgi:hypothetical protein